MKIVIDIPEEDYKFIKELRLLTPGRGSCKTIQYHIINAIKFGIILPKGHGRLIDANAYQTTLEEKAKRLKNLDTINGLCGAVALLSDTETIIEADKE